MSTLAESRAALAASRSLLFVPGNRPERFAKAIASGADAVVLDLEDAVPPAQKAAAREAVGEALRVLPGNVPLILRVSTPASEAGVQDLSWLSQQPAPAGVMVAKSESADDLAAVRRVAPDAALLPLVESAAGYAALPHIAAAGGVLRLVVGHIDFMADTGLRCSADERELDPLRFAVAMHTRLHRLEAAVDGVTTAIDDDERLRRDTRRALNFGFGAKLCIHPRQVAVVHEALEPLAEEVAWARRVIAADAAAAGAAVQLDGKMVDLPVVLQARRILARLRNQARGEGA